MAMSAWADCFLTDLMSELVDASLQLVQDARDDQPVNLLLLRSFTECLGKTYTLRFSAFIDDAVIRCSTTADE